MHQRRIADCICSGGRACAQIAVTYRLVRPTLNPEVWHGHFVSVNLGKQSLRTGHAQRTPCNTKNSVPPHVSSLTPVHASSYSFDLAALIRPSPRMLCIIIVSLAPEPSFTSRHSHPQIQIPHTCDHEYPVQNECVSVAVARCPWSVIPQSLLVTLSHPQSPVLAAPNKESGTGSTRKGTQLLGAEPYRPLPKRFPTAASYSEFTTTASLTVNHNAHATSFNAWVPATWAQPTASCLACESLMATLRVFLTA
jgi:hypothetical protein